MQYVGKTAHILYANVVKDPPLTEFGSFSRFRYFHQELFHRIELAEWRDAFFSLPVKIFLRLVDRISCCQLDTSFVVARGRERKERIPGRDSARFAIPFSLYLAASFFQLRLRKGYLFSFLTLIQSPMKGEIYNSLAEAGARISPIHFSSLSVTNSPSLWQH